MYDIDSTIAAISSGPAEVGSAQQSIIRITGPGAFDALDGVFDSTSSVTTQGLYPGTISIDSQIKVPATIYAFIAPASYTGQDMAEIHLLASPPAIDKLVAALLEKVAMAGPGEFTLRAYQNGKIDLAKAEAVAGIVAASNQLQLQAAEKLLQGNLSVSMKNLQNDILDIASLIEAGLDFSGEDIAFISPEDAAKRISAICQSLKDILNSSIHFEETIDLPAVGLAGCANAGKSSLMNRLTSTERSIVSDQQATTRDVLTSRLKLDNTRCALFDCAGLMEKPCKSVIDRLAQQAAIEALNSADIVVFCIDISKENYSAEKAILDLIQPREIIMVATKNDLVDDTQPRLQRLTTEFDKEFVTVSIDNTESIDTLKKTIDAKLLDIAGKGTRADLVAINERHKLSLTSAIESLGVAAEEIQTDNDEIAAMLLRQSFEQLILIERNDTDEEILDRIFSRFCIGK